MLKDEEDRRLLARNSLAVLFLAAILSAPFLFSSASYFGERGFLDRFGGFCGVLTGFYIAALVGIASFSSASGGLDDEIEVGRIYCPLHDGEPLALTRREYVSAIFGYLSFVSLGLSVLAILSVSAAGVAIKVMPHWTGYVAVIGFNIVLSHMMITTCHGLYYFIDRIYYQKPELLPISTQKANPVTQRKQI